MDPAEIDALVRRLVDNPYDEEALAYAHGAGSADPTAYALLLEKIGEETVDPQTASHWLSEAGQVWATTLGDPHRAARVYMQAVERDPTQSVAVERLGELYREKGDFEALAKLLERRVRLLKPMLPDQPELRGELAGMHEELGRVWSEPPLQDAERALENFHRALEYDPESAYAMYNARELLKAQGAWQEAFALYASELRVEQDPVRRVALLRDEAQTRRAAGDLAGATQALALARQSDDLDPALAQEYSSSVLDRLQAGDPVPVPERELAAELLVRLAESYDGEHGLAYAGAALDASPGSARGLQLYSHYARQTGHEEDLATRMYAYLQASPDGSEAGDARLLVAGSYEAVGQFADAISMLEPLAALGEPHAVARLRELQGRLATAHSEPPASLAPRQQQAPRLSTPVPRGSGAGPSAIVTPSGVAGSGGASIAGNATVPHNINMPPLMGGPDEDDSVSVTGALANVMSGDPHAPHLREGAREGAREVATRLDVAPHVSPPPHQTNDDSQASMVFTDSGESERRPGLTPDQLQGLLDAAQMLAGKGKKPEALAKYREALETQANHPEALGWVEDYLRSKRDYGQLREVLLASVVTVSPTSPIVEPVEIKKERLREIAGLSEGNLRDVNGAIEAWEKVRGLDPKDDSARAALARLFDKTQRWDDLAALLEEDAHGEDDLDTRISAFKKLASLQETKRKDLVAAGEAWASIADLTPEDDRPASTASKLFERGGRLDRATDVLTRHAAHVEDPVARGQLLERLGELREQAGDLIGAGTAYGEAADAVKNGRLWESAERCFAAADDFRSAAGAAVQRASVSTEAKQQAAHFFRASELFARSGLENESMTRLEQAADLDPFSDEYAAQLVDRYTRGQRWDALARHLSTRGDRLTDRSKRVAVRRQAAALYNSQLSNKDLAREQWLKVLEDGDDREALEKLIDVAVEREDHNEAVTLLRRLGQSAVDRAEKARVALREAELLAEGVGDIDTAIARYEAIVQELDPTCRPALQAIAELQERRGRMPEAADALERELKLIPDSQERGQIGARLANLYEGLGDVKNAIRALDIVRKADLEDFDALTRLCDLCERAEQWDRVAELLAQRIDIEGDDQELSAMTRKLATILADHLDRGDEALAALTELADQGDIDCRNSYVALGDGLGWKGLVASKLVDWWLEARPGAERIAALRGAFDRFEQVGRDHDAVRIALEVVRSKGADRDFATRLEVLAVKTNDHDALSMAHDLLAREVSGEARAYELVRQAEARVRAGMARNEAIQHGEVGLAGVSPADADPLLERLAALAGKPNDVVDLYERQVSRSKQPADRVRALARVAQVAALRGQLDRARGFFELALTGSPTDETLTTLEDTAREADRSSGGEKLRRALAISMAAGGQGARDGGRTRSGLLRRAAMLVFRELDDVDQGFVWWGDSLVANVDAAALDVLEQLAREVGDMRRAENALTHALGEVFDGPLVRQLLARRAYLRRNETLDFPGAAADLKRLLDLSPLEQSVMDELAALLVELQDYRGMVQLYEDQILRGKEAGVRAELARKVARLWEEQLVDAREAADAWRRVLRMRQNDPEAIAGLERAKMGALKRPDGDLDAYAPPRMNSGPPSIGPGQPPRSERPPASRSLPPTMLGSVRPSQSQVSRGVSEPPSSRPVSAAPPRSTAPTAPVAPVAPRYVATSTFANEHVSPAEHDDVTLANRSATAAGIASSRFDRPSRPDLSFAAHNEEKTIIGAPLSEDGPHGPDITITAQINAAMAAAAPSLRDPRGHLVAVTAAVPAAGPTGPTGTSAGELPAELPTIMFAPSSSESKLEATRVEIDPYENDDDGDTGEVQSHDFLDTTISRPREEDSPRLTERNPITDAVRGIYEEEIVVDDDMSEMIELGDADDADDLPGTQYPPKTARS
jgi:tetratricopeptide (TPR) repeat protein